MASLRPGALLLRAIAGFVAVAIAAAIVLSIMMPNGPVPVHVRWTRATTDAERASLEQRYQLTRGEVTEGTTRAYRLADTSSANIRALVQDPHVEDTTNLNRVRFRPGFWVDRQRRMIAYTLLAGVIGAIGAVYLSLKPRNA